MNNADLLNKYRDFLLARGQSLNYWNVIRIFLAYMETQKLEQVNQEIITNFFNQNNYSKNSRNQFIKAGRDYFTNFLQIPKENNEWYKIKLLKVERKIPDYLTEKEIEEAKKYLITYFSRKMTSTKIRALIDFMFVTGIRKAELLNLKRKDIDLENCKTKVFGKGEKERYIYFTDSVKIEIEDYFKTEVEEENAFCISLGQLHYLMKKIKQYLGKNVYCHLLRHSGARQMIKKGIPIGAVSRILGHNSLTVTMMYVDENEEDRRNTYKQKMG